MADENILSSSCNISSALLLLKSSFLHDKLLLRASRLILRCKPAWDASHHLYMIEWVGSNDMAGDGSDLDENNEVISTIGTCYR